LRLEGEKGVHKTHEKRLSLNYLDFPSGEVNKRWNFS